jgi:hypothetical protein
VKGQFFPLNSLLPKAHLLAFLNVFSRNPNSLGNEREKRGEEEEEEELNNICGGGDHHREREF